MKNRLAVPGLALLIILLALVIGSCSNNPTQQPEVSPPRTSTPEPLNTPLLPAITGTFTPIATISAPATQMPAQIPVEPSSTPTAMTAFPVEQTTAEVTLDPGMPGSGVWISTTSRRNSQVWTQFEVYYQDGQPMVDVLEACVSYHCDYLGDNFEAEGCSGKKSPKNIPIKNGKFTIDFQGIMNETKTLHSKLGIIYGQVLDQNTITGSWEIPVCDNWLLFEVEHAPGAAVP